jgi:hypothetical protein
MKIEDIHIGDKVIPIGKTPYSALLNDPHWKSARQANQYFMFVTKIVGDEITLNEKFDKGHGNIYYPIDLLPYSENEEIFQRFQYTEQ